MVLRGRLRQSVAGALLVALLIGLGAIVPVGAEARPPRTALVRDGVGMAGVRVGIQVALDRAADPVRVTEGPMSDWGPVASGFCFEGTACFWDVPGGGAVGATIGATDDRLRELWTRAPRWRTLRGGRVGDGIRRVQGRYDDRLTRQRTCSIGDFGAVLDVLVAPGRRTAFELRRGRVETIWVLARRLPRRDSCDATPERITAAGVGAVRLGATFRDLRRARLVGPLRLGCELSSPRPRIAALRSPLRGTVVFSRTSPRRVRTVTVTGGAVARGVGVGDRARAIRRAFPRVRFDHGTDETFGVTLAIVPPRGGGPLQFAVDTGTRRVTTIAVPAIPFCE